jgi:hypothetical protein
LSDAPLVDDARKTIMIHDSSPITAPVFLRLRQAIATNPDVLDKFDEQLIGMSSHQPTEAAQILTALVGSDDVEDRKSAAAYLWHLFAERHKMATELTRTLLVDSDEDVREFAADGVVAAVDHGAITATHAARILDIH